MLTLSLSDLLQNIFINDSFCRYRLLEVRFFNDDLFQKEPE
jgi:hypothetical protein